MSEDVNSVADEVVEQNEQQTTSVENIGVVKKNRNAMSIIANFLLAISILCFVAQALLAFSWIVSILIIVVAFLLMILTLFAFYQDMMGWIENAEEFAITLQQANAIIPYLLYIGTGSGVVALLMFIFNKNYIHRKSKIITTSVIIVLNIVIEVIKFIVFGQGGI